MRLDKRINWRRAVYLLPITLPVGLAAFSIVAVTLLLFGQFKSFFVWPLGLLAAAWISLQLHRYFPVKQIKKSDLIAVAVVLGGTVLWSGLNFFYSSQHVYTNRDPGVYAEAGVWLIEHDSIRIPKTGAFDQINVVSEESAGFRNNTTNENELYAQGTHILPALLGLAGRIGGGSLLFKTAPLIAGFALLAVFAFARELMRNRWAILATTVFSLCLPAIYFSRDTYTEMIAAALIFGSLTTFVAATKLNSRRLWLVAGIMTGAGALTRIDAFVSMAGVGIALITYLILSKKRDRRDVLKNTGIFIVSAAAISTIGILDLAVLSSGYFKDLTHNLKVELVALSVLAVVGVVATWVAWNTKTLKTLDKNTKSWRPIAAALLIVFIALLLTSRPLWMVAHDSSGEGIRKHVEATQAAAGLPIDGLRSYAELTTLFTAWYIGPIIALMSILGAAIVAYRSMNSKDIRWVLVGAVVLGTGLLYFIKPSITPDQIWASRRLLPVVIPGLVIFGALALDWLSVKKDLPFGIRGISLVSVLTTLALAWPVYTLQPFLFTRTRVPHLAQVESICSLVQKKKSVVIWVGTASRVAVQPTRNLCDIPTAGVVGEEISKRELIEITKKLSKEGYRPIVGFMNGDGQKIKGAQIEREEQSLLVSSVEAYEYVSSFVAPPRAVISSDTSLYLGEITLKGTIEPLKAE